MITTTTTELRAYVTKRLADGTLVRQKRKSGAERKGVERTCQNGRCQRAKIHRELTVLKRMFSLDDFRPVFYCEFGCRWLPDDGTWTSFGHTFGHTLTDANVCL